MTAHDPKIPNQFKTRPEWRNFRRRTNAKVAAMYAMYLTGKSLEHVAKVYGVTRQSVYECFRSRGYAMRSKKVLPFIIVDGVKFTPSHKGGYWRATRRDKNVMLSHYIWEKHHGPVPEGYGVHNKDLDRSNCAIENLELLSIAEISRQYSPHLNQFTSLTGSRIWRRARFGDDHRFARSTV